MRLWRRLQRPALLVLVALTLFLPLTPVRPEPAVAAPAGPRALFFVSDGMRPDLMERYAAAGAMPTYRKLMEAGVRGENGLLQGFPPNTGVGWHTLATGTWPSEHG